MGKLKSDSSPKKSAVAPVTNLPVRLEFLELVLNYIAGNFLKIEWKEIYLEFSSMSSGCNSDCSDKGIKCWERN